MTSATVSAASTLSASRKGLTLLCSIVTMPRRHHEIKSPLKTFNRNSLAGLRGFLFISPAGGQLTQQQRELADYIKQNYTKSEQS